MKLLAQINSLMYIHDLKEIGLEAVLVGNKEISSRCPLSLSLEEMEQLQNDFDVYVKMNELYHETELELVEKWLKAISKTKIKGIVFQDWGLFYSAKQLNMSQRLVYMPETLNTNYKTLNDFASFGLESAFVSREIPIEDIIEIAQNSVIDLIVQVHGIMYMSSSNRLLLTNYFESIQKQKEDKVYSLKAKDSDLESWIYEDKFGCHIHTKDELVGIDYLSKLNLAKVEFGFIDCQMMDDYRALEIISIYHDLMVALDKGTYTKEIHEYRPLLNRLMAGHKASTGFYEDKTVYRLEDVRGIDNEKRN